MTQSSCVCSAHSRTDDVALHTWMATQGGENKDHNAQRDNRLDHLGSSPRQAGVQPAPDRRPYSTPDTGPDRRGDAPLQTALLRFVWARGRIALVPPASIQDLRGRSGDWLEGRRGRTPCGQSLNVASDRGDKPGTTPLCISLLAPSARGVAPGLPPLIQTFPTLRRDAAAAA
jgi:hypothetical protein